MTNPENSTQNSAPPGGKRKVLLIDPTFQLTFLSFTFVVAFSILLIVFCVNTYFFFKFQSLGNALHLKPDHVIYQFLGYEKSTLETLFLFLTACVVAVLGSFGLVFSHRIAGPLYRLRQHMLEDVEKGELTPVQFRTKDYFPEIAEAYNRLAASKKKNGA